MEKPPSNSPPSDRHGEETDTTRVRLSVVVIAFNEADEIDDCLRSVDWADEIVVVDSGSADRTVEIARRYTARIIHRTWTGYADQKNFAVSQATHDWVFSLDADERVSEALALEVRTLLADTPRHAGFYIPRRNFFLGRPIRYAGWSPDDVLRLFDRRTGRFEPRAVHESVHIEGSVGRLQHPIIHFSYRTLSAFHERAGRYAHLAAGQMREEGKRFHWMDLLGRPVWTFLKMYVIRQGWREGGHGMLLCGLYAYYTFLKYARLWEMQRSDSK